VTTQIPAPKRKAPAPRPAVSTPAPAPTPVTPPVGSGESPGAEAEKTVRSYWKTLADGDLSGAYDYLSPETRQPRDYWISLRSKDGLRSANFTKLATISSSSSEATVSVDLVTRQTSCQPQRWVGTYHVVNTASGWLIRDHNFPNPPPC
jgi:hypothetical protein